MVNTYHIFYPIEIIVGIDETTAQIDETSITASDSDWLEKQIRENKTMSGFTTKINIQEDNMDTGVYIHLDNDILDNNELFNSTVIHESYHACNIIYKHIQAIPDIDNDEPFAYLLSYVYRCCIDTINEYKRNNNHNNEND